MPEEALTSLSYHAYRSIVCKSGIVIEVRKVTHRISNTNE